MRSRPLPRAQLARRQPRSKSFLRSQVALSRDSPRPGGRRRRSRARPTCIIVSRRRVSRAMTRYRRQVLMSLVHQLSYRPLGEVSNIGVTEAGWGVQRRRPPLALSLPRHIDATIAIKTRYSGTFSTSTSTAHRSSSPPLPPSPPPCLRQASTTSASPPPPPTVFLSPLPSRRGLARTLDRSLSSCSAVLPVDTLRTASTSLVHFDTSLRATRSRWLRSRSNNNPRYRIFLPDAFSIYHVVCRGYER